MTVNMCPICGKYWKPLRNGEPHYIKIYGKIEYDKKPCKFCMDYVRDE